MKKTAVLCVTLLAAVAVEYVYIQVSKALDEAIAGVGGFDVPG